MNIRLATPDDIPALQALYAEVDDLHAQAHPERFQKPQGPSRSAQYLMDLMSGDPDELALLVAEEDGEVTGMAYLIVYRTADLPILVPRRLVLVDNLVVRSDQRGRGAGQALMAAAEDWARQRGIRELELNVYEFNQPARRFYDRLGYRRVSCKLWKRLEDG